jgi:tetratricopeptide (TPR) repeat protein
MPHEPRKPTSTALTRSGLSADRPFPGLRPYYLEDHDYFFGREDQIYALYRLFDHSRFVAVVGSSGSGKSSLVRAGLLPLIEKESSEPTGRIWEMIQMHPGDMPIGNLAAAMARRFFPREDANIAAARQERIKFALRRSSFGMSEALHEIEGLGDTSIILVVDQFEELFRYAARRQDAEAQRHEEATQFVQVLLAASRDRALNVYVMLTMRSDFIGDCANFRDLPEAVSASQFLVPSLTRDQREEAIRRPIEKAGATIEPELVERLLNDGGDDIDQLPVLQHCLLRIWEAARAPGGRDLTTQNYLDVGGISSALSNHADDILQSLRGAEMAVEQTFRSLAEIDHEGRIVRRPRLYRELLAETGVPADDLQTVVNRFRDDDCSFLTPPKSEIPELTGETRIDVGHEALLRRWERVSGDPRTGAPEIGWIRAEEADGRNYRGLLAMAESRAGRIATDSVEARWKWWKERPRKAAWAERYGGNIEAVEQLFSDSLAALEAEKARQEAERAAEQRRNEAEARQAAEIQRIELEGQAQRARQEAERARLELAAETARAREMNALREARLARRTALIVSALLCLTIALGYFAYRQWQFALQQEANAERGLVIQGDLTRALLGQVLQRLNTGNISVDSAKGLLNTAQQNLSGLQEAAQTPEIRAIQANLLLGFADVYSALQDDNSALHYAQQAQTLAMQLVGDEANNTSYQNLLYSADFRIGDAEADLSKFNDSLRPYQAALAIARNLAAKEPANYVWMQNVAFILNKIGDIYKVKGPSDQALKQYQAALDIDQQLAHDHPGIDSLQRDVATALTRVGDLQKDSGNLIDALAQYQSALAIRKQLAGSTSDADLQSNLSVAYNRVADMLVQQEKFDEAAPLYDSALTIRKNLAASDPTNSTWQSYLAFEYVYIGDMLTKKKDFGGAVDNYRQALGIRNELVAKDSTNFTWLKNLADSHTTVAGSLFDEGDLPGALAEHNAALALRLKVGAQFPDGVTRHREIIDEYIAIGAILAQQGDIAAARASYLDAVKVADDFAAKHPGSKSLDDRRTSVMQRIAALAQNSP